MSGQRATPRVENNGINLPPVAGRHHGHAGSHNGWVTLCGCGAGWRPQALCTVQACLPGKVSHLGPPKDQHTLILSTNSDRQHSLGRLYFFGKNRKKCTSWVGKDPLTARQTRVSNKYARTFKYVGRPGRSPCRHLTLQPGVRARSQQAQGPQAALQGGGPAASPRLESLGERPRRGPLTPWGRGAGPGARQKGSRWTKAGACGTAKAAAPRGRLLPSPMG